MLLLPVGLWLPADQRFWRCFSASRVRHWNAKPTHTNGDILGCSHRAALPDRCFPWWRHVCAGVRMKCVCVCVCSAGPDCRVVYSHLCVHVIRLPVDTCPSDRTVWIEELGGNGGEGGIPGFEAQKFTWGESRLLQETVITDWNLKYMCVEWANYLHSLNSNRVFNSLNTKRNSNLVTAFVPVYRNECVAIHTESNSWTLNINHKKMNGKKHMNVERVTVVSS